MSEAEPPRKTPSASDAIVSELMMPHQVNNLGHLFGGVVLSMADQAAGIAAMRHSGMPCVTVGIDSVEFKEPIFAGEVVTCRARVNYVGRTSMEVGVQVVTENLLTGKRRHTNSCFLTFVAIDEDHRPTHVPPLELETPEDERRFHDGRRRREARQQLDRELHQEGS